MHRRQELIRGLQIPTETKVQVVGCRLVLFTRVLFTDKKTNLEGVHPMHVVFWMIGGFDFGLVNSPQSGPNCPINRSLDRHDESFKIPLELLPQADLYIRS